MFFKMCIHTLYLIKSIVTIILNSKPFFHLISYAINSILFGDGLWFVRLSI